MEQARCAKDLDIRLSLLEACTIARMLAPLPFLL